MLAGWSTRGSKGIGKKVPQRTISRAAYKDVGGVVLPYRTTTVLHSDAGPDSLFLMRNGSATIEIESKATLKTNRAAEAIVLVAACRPGGRLVNNATKVCVEDTPRWLKQGATSSR